MDIKDLALRLQEKACTTAKELFVLAKEVLSS